MRTTLVFLVFLVLYSVARAETIFPVRIDDGDGFFDALQSGDAGAIEQLIKTAHTPGRKQLYLAGKLRIRGDINGSAAAAAQCYEPAKVTGKQGGTSLFCGILLAENALNNGDIATWARIMEAIRVNIMPEYTKDADFILNGLRQKLKAHGQSADDLKYTSYRFDFFSLVDDFSPFEDWPYVTRVSNPVAQNDTIPVVWHGGSSQGHHIRLPYIHFVINGKPVEGLLDTGTEDNLLLNQQLAQNLGITRITPGWLTVNRLGGSKQASALGNAPLVAIGSTQLHNVPVTITDTGNVSAIIGTNLLRQLGDISLSERELTITSSPAVTCQTPLVMASPVRGSFGLMLYSIQVNGSLIKNTLIDTGTPVLVYVAQDNITLPAPSLHIEPDSANIPYHGGHADFNIAGTLYPQLSFPIFRRTTLYNYGLGSGLLRHHSLTMDFRLGHLCIVPSGGGKDTAISVQKSGGPE